MKTYIVKWTETHLAEARADNREKAIDKAMMKTQEETLHSINRPTATVKTLTKGKSGQEEEKVNENGP